MGEIGFCLSAFPVTTPFLDRAHEVGAFVRIVLIAPLHVVGDDDGRHTNLDALSQMGEVIVREDDATVAGTGWTAIGIAWRAM